MIIIRNPNFDWNWRFCQKWWNLALLSVISIWFISQKLSRIPTLFTVSDASSSLWDHIFKHSMHIFQWNLTKLWSGGGKGVVDHVLKFRGDPNNITEVTATKASLVWPKCNVKATLIRRPYLAISRYFWIFLLQSCFN